ncbi:MAG: OadG family protein [Treponema sp.]|jgi:oxaloacetate decarboxylase gamma subunit|nr:OadG family protein [Treponema sp.]
MTIIEMLEQSALLTVLGMAVVFAFLWFMIISVNATAKLVHKMGWDKDVQESKNPPSGNTSRPAAPEITAAITAAVTEYREKERRE